MIGGRRNQAFDSNRDCADRHWCAALVGKPHPDAGNDKIHSKRRGGYLCGALAFERVRGA